MSDEENLKKMREAMGNVDKDDCVTCDEKKEESEYFPNCARCGKEILTEQEYEALAGSFLHKFCYDEALLCIILSAPSLEEINTMKKMRDMMKNFMPGGVSIDMNDEHIPVSLKKFAEDSV